MTTEPKLSEVSRDGGVLLDEFWEGTERRAHRNADGSVLIIVWTRDEDGDWDIDDPVDIVNFDPDEAAKLASLLSARATPSAPRFESDMSKHDLFRALSECRRAVESNRASGPSADHIREMLDKTAGFVDAGRVPKAMRWLGFVQGWLWTQGLATIDEMRKWNAHEVLLSAPSAPSVSTAEAAEMSGIAVRAYEALRGLPAFVDVQAHGGSLYVSISDPAAARHYPGHVDGWGLKFSIRPAPPAPVSRAVVPMVCGDCGAHGTPVTLAAGRWTCGNCGAWWPDKPAPLPPLNPRYAGLERAIAAMPPPVSGAPEYLVDPDSAGKARPFCDRCMDRPRCKRAGGCVDAGEGPGEDEPSAPASAPLLVTGRTVDHDQLLWRLGQVPLCDGCQTSVLGAINGTLPADTGPASAPGGTAPPCKRICVMRVQGGDREEPSGPDYCDLYEASEIWAPCAGLCHVDPRQPFDGICPRCGTHGNEGESCKVCKPAAPPAATPATPEETP